MRRVSNPYPDRTFSASAYHDQLKATLVADYGGCQLCCETENLVLHHRRYPGHFKETTDDVTLLCQDCHDLFHMANNYLANEASNRERRTAARRIVRSAVGDSSIERHAEELAEVRRRAAERTRAKRLERDQEHQRAVQADRERHAAEARRLSTRRR